MDYTIDEIENYYSINHKNKIFCTRLNAKGKNFAILYNYDKEEEINKFVSNFTEYFPFFVYNEDRLDSIDSNCNLPEELIKISKSCWHGPNVPSREMNSNGIFGEVFLDFYERIVMKNKLGCTYVSRRDFKSKYENKGFDNLYFVVKDKQIEFVFSEAKFVSNKYNATDSLVKDIKGEPADGNKKAIIGHLTKEFMNDYAVFVVDKNTYFSDSDKALLKPFFKKINKALTENKNNFISYLIENDIRVNCVFFAIFQSLSSNPEDYLASYDKIYDEAKNNLEAIGFTNYSIEIVFVPTNSKSVDIKGAISQIYE